MHVEQEKQAKQSKKAIITLCGYGLLIISTVLAAYYFMLPEKTIAQRSAEYKQELRKEASAAVHILIEEHLKGQEVTKQPGSGDSGESVAINMSNYYTVSSWVELEDSSGTLSRRKYTAKVKYLPPKDKWVLLSVKFAKSL